MRRISTLLFAAFLLTAAAPATAQEPVVGAPNPESLFTDKDPRLHANKQVALHIMRELLQCNYWDQADRWLTDRYIQHNPNAASGREGVVKFFNSLKRPRAASCDKLTTPIVAVLAQGDLVTVVWPMTCRHEGQKPYTSTWFDMWRITDGKADEHWDPGMRIQTGCTPGQ
jgi:predicted SnoaL-like aldol condensation-catalyzing enzyme